jgi:hypothetical protein
MHRFVARALGIIAVCTTVAASSAELTPTEFCYGWATELVRQAEHCASSVRHPQLGFNYGPDNLFTKRNAWCEGAAGQGIGEWVVIRLDPPLIFRKIYVVNGYVRLPKTFSDNSRVKRIDIETSNGFAMSALLEDRPDEQTIQLPKAERADWIKFTIKDVYRGEKYEDTCLSGLMVDIEESQRP